MGQGCCSKSDIESYLIQPPELTYPLTFKHSKTILINPEDTQPQIIANIIFLEPQDYQENTEVIFSSDAILCKIKPQIENEFVRHTISKFGKYRPPQSPYNERITTYPPYVVYSLTNIFIFNK